jgi:cathepsin A (carboxypeptidase C)
MEAISADVGYQINPYNVKVPCGPDPLCYNFDNVTRLLNTPSVQHAIGAKGTWETCNMEVHGFLVSTTLVY